jgi:hypothetical protein
MYTITSHSLHQSLAQRMETLHHPQLVSAHVKCCTKMKSVLCVSYRDTLQCMFWQHKTNTMQKEGMSVNEKK